MTQHPAGPTWTTFLVSVTGAVLGGAFFVVWLGPETELLPLVDGSGTRASLEGTMARYSVQPGEVFAMRRTDPLGAPRSGPRPPASQVPVALEIPAIEVATPLVRLGLMPDHTAEVPDNADEAGWFGRGPAPGEIGSSVVLGHVDSEDGPAVFARLEQLRRGDAVLVRTEAGRQLRFVVMSSVSYPNAEFPADRVYARSGARRLNLVTCAGAYDQDNGGYQENLVVYTRRTGDAKP